MFNAKPCYRVKVINGLVQWTATVDVMWGKERSSQAYGWYSLPFRCCNTRHFLNYTTFWITAATTLHIHADV